MLLGSSLHSEDNVAINAELSPAFCNANANFHDASLPNNHTQVSCVVRVPNAIPKTALPIPSVNLHSFPVLCDSLLQVLAGFQRHTQVQVKQFRVRSGATLQTLRKH